MEYTIAKLENAQSKVTFTVDTAEWVAARTKAYQKTKGQYRVSGFRPGKAPQKTIERMYGESCFYEEAIDILLEEGYIKSFEEIDDNSQGIIRITLKYVNKQKVISGLKRVSKPGLRVYATKDELPKVIGGLGIALISTSKGIMTDKKARQEGVGGEVLAFVW